MVCLLAMFQETFKRNYGKSLIKRQWMNGAFSKAEKFTDLPVKHMCPMNAEDWGEILDRELST